MTLSRRTRWIFAGLLACWTAVQAQAPLPAAVNTDPLGALKIVLPEPANPALPTVMLIGDSTVRNGRDDGQNLGVEGQWGWGTPIAAYFDASKVNLVNRAIGGLSSRTYISGTHWQRTVAHLKRGDTLLIQFGHNDSSAINDNSRARGTIKGIGEESQDIVNQLTGQAETVHSYGWYLRFYIAQAKAMGVKPVIVSPVPRKRWDEAGKIGRSSGNGYAGWAAEVAKQEGVPFIDLNELVAQRYDSMGREAVMSLFPRVTPDESVHTNWAGALLNAQIVVASLQQQKAVPAEYILAADKVKLALPVAKPKEDDRPVVDAARVSKEAPMNAQLPSLFIVGDSTVRSGGQNGAYGWGERIAPFFDTAKINIVNHAIGGRSSRTFLTEGRWASVMAQLKAGDFVLIQFGHNDGGRIGDPASKRRASGPGIGDEVVDDPKPDGTSEQVHTFGWYMARYIADARAKGATVVVLSPIPHKDKWQQGRDFENFAQWGEQVAKAGGAQFIDLTLLVAAGYKGIGEEKVNAFFSDARTHTNEAGAVFNAARVVDGLRLLPGNPFAAYLSGAADAQR